MHGRKDPLRDAGLDLLQVHRAVHQQLDADIGVRQSHGQGATAFSLPPAAVYRAAASTKLAIRVELDVSIEWEYAYYIRKKYVSKIQHVRPLQPPSKTRIWSHRRSFGGA